MPFIPFETLSRPHMFPSALSSLLSAWFAFFLPCYATFKVLSHRPVDAAELQKYAMYWSVIGSVVAFEYVAEWLISWLPFYSEVKTLFFLYLALPQIQGSTYIYMTFLEPFFRQNERELDSGIVALQRNILTLLQAKLAALWDLVCSFTTKQQQSAGQGNPPVSWLSPDAVRDALSIMYGRSGAQSAPTTSRQNSNIGAVNPVQPPHDTSAVPSPVPQYFHPSS